MVVNENRLVESEQDSYVISETMRLPRYLPLLRELSFQFESWSVQFACLIHKKCDFGCETGMFLHGPKPCQFEFYEGGITGIAMS